MFVDIAKIKVKAGDGGEGTISFHREKYVASGGPDGGDGGKGGDVVFIVDSHLSTLIDFKYKKNYEAQKGGKGSKNNCKGKDGEDLVIKVPRGTLIKDVATERIIADLSDDAPVVIARGGRGGKGNSNFATPTRQAPRFTKPPGFGQEIELNLELKLLADVGIVGFPNVGKSSLISAVSAAKPKIANYHFTTLVPVLGVIKMEEGNSFVMADIPGLIEGASGGLGLGHAFLRHIERCRLILHIVDVSGSEGRDPKEDFDKINSELKNFNEELWNRPQIVAANKCDIATVEQISEFKKYIQEKGYEFFEISAVTTEGTKKLVNEIGKKLVTLPPIKEYIPEPVIYDETDNSGNQFKIEEINGKYIVDAPWLERILWSVNINDYESLQYFQRVLRKSGIIDKLEEMGINEGDTVDIFGFEFDFIN